MESEASLSKSFQDWFSNLNPAIKDQIKDLHKKDLSWNWILLFFYVLWIGAAFTMYLWPNVVVKVICFTVIGAAIHGMANLMHEGMHNNLFNSKLNNWLFGFVAGIPSLFSVTAYKVNHLIHHKYTGTDKDPDELFNITSNKFLIRVMFYVILLVGVFLYLFHVPVNAIRFGSNSERRQILLEYTIMIAIYTAVIYFSLKFDFFQVVLNVWLIPIVFAVLFGNIRGWAEHMLTEKTTLFLTTRTVTSTKIFSFLNLNLNYHLEHHLFPNIPWYNLPKLHKLLLPEYKLQRVTVFDSYLKFLWLAFRKGPFRTV